MIIAVVLDERNLGNWILQPFTPLNNWSSCLSHLQFFQVFNHCVTVYIQKCFCRKFSRFLFDIIIEWILYLRKDGSPPNPGRPPCSPSHTSSWNRILKLSQSGLIEQVSSWKIFWLWSNAFSYFKVVFMFFFPDLAQGIKIIFQQGTLLHS